METALCHQQGQPGKLYISSCVPWMLQTPASKLFPGIFKSGQSEQEILDGIVDESLFGFIIADISVTEPAFERWKDFPPVLRRMTITEEHLPEIMKKTFKKENPEMRKFERETLCQVFNASDQVILTPLVKFYLEQGFKISNVTTFVQFISFPALLPFCQHVTQMRIDAELNGLSTKGATAKG